MNEHEGIPGWVAFAAVAAMSALALASPRASSPEPHAEAVVSTVAVTTPPELPTVQVWLSTADRHLRLARQPDVQMTARESLPDDVVIDTHATYQSMVGFGAAITDASAWLMQNRMTDRSARRCCTSCSVRRPAST